MAAATCCAATWRQVPGAADAQIDIDSLQQDGSRVLAWLRWPGRPPLVLEPAAFGAQPARVHRTHVLLEFDCLRRKVRALATSSFDGRGTPLSMSSVPGAPQPAGEGDTAWAYDAACEAARSGGRL